MDYSHVLSLIAVRTGNAKGECAALKAGGSDSKAPIFQILRPRPLPSDEIEDKTLFCGTVQVPVVSGIPIPDWAKAVKCDGVNETENQPERKT
jgi:hypothetical protein